MQLALTASAAYIWSHPEMRRIVVKRVPVVDEDIALYSISQSEVDLAIHHLSKDPLLGTPVAGEVGIRVLRFGKYDIVYHPLENYEVIVLLQIRPFGDEPPKLIAQARKALAELGRIVAREGLKRWLRF
jgi:hypothetical protein